jgi:hypothetical protein
MFELLAYHYHFRNFVFDIQLNLMLLESLVLHYTLYQILIRLDSMEYGMKIIKNLSLENLLNILLHLDQFDIDIRFHLHDYLHVQLKPMMYYQIVRIQQLQELVEEYKHLNINNCYKKNVHLMEKHENLLNYFTHTHK